MSNAGLLGMWLLVLTANISYLLICYICHEIRGEVEKERINE